MEHHSCSGCSLCLLVCPVWRETRDVRLTPRGRAKATQHGARRADIAASVAGCTLCGACEPACPEDLPLVDMVMGLRREAPLPEISRKGFPGKRQLLLAGRALGADPVLRQRTLALLGDGFEMAADDGCDVADSLEAGAVVAAERLEAFLAALREARRLVVAEGILLRTLRRWLPRTSIAGLGEVLSKMRRVQSALGPGDLYVIESRAFNGDHARLVGHYDALRTASGCAMNLDLQRIAIPAMGAEAQARWILEGRKVERIVVEDLADREAFAFSGRPVVHVADLA